MGSIRPDPNILKKHPNAITQQQIDEKGRFIGAVLGAAAGELTGDPGNAVSLTLLLMRSLVSRKQLDLEDVGRGLLRWFGTKPAGLSGLMRAALENLRAGEPPMQSGAIAWEDSERKGADDGSLVCCAPIGLLHAKNLDGLSDDAAAFSRITHSDPRCVAGCIGVATAIAWLVRGHADEAIERAASAAGAVSDDARLAIERGAARKPADVHAAGDFVLGTLELAFSALGSASSFEAGTAAAGRAKAVAGALLGAKLGKNQIPDKLLAKAKAAPELGSLATSLYGLL
jgi:ADP-ribosylglycohydrolase